MRQHSFRGSLGPTTEPAVRRRFRALYERLYPDAVRLDWLDSDRVAQRAGIDVLIHLETGSAIRVDEKIRYHDYRDMLIEVWSDYDRRVPGWTLDEHKETQYIAYAVAGRGICYWLPAARLRRAALRNLDSSWILTDRRYPRIAENHDGSRRWYTWNVAVSWFAIARALDSNLADLSYPW